MRKKALFGAASSILGAAMLAGCTGANNSKVLAAAASPKPIVSTSVVQKAAAVVNPKLDGAVFFGGSDGAKGSRGCSPSAGIDGCYAVFKMQVSADGQTAHFQLWHSWQGYKTIDAGKVPSYVGSEESTSGPVHVLPGGGLAFRLDKHRTYKFSLASPGRYVGDQFYKGYSRTSYRDATNPAVMIRVPADN